MQNDRTSRSRGKGDLSHVWPLGTKPGVAAPGDLHPLRSRSRGLKPVLKNPCPVPSPYCVLRPCYSWEERSKSWPLPQGGSREPRQECGGVDLTPPPWPGSPHPLPQSEGQAAGLHEMSCVRDSVGAGGRTPGIPEGGPLATLGGLARSCACTRARTGLQQKQGRLPGGGGGPSDGGSSQRAGAEAGAGRPGLPAFPAAASPARPRPQRCGVRRPLFKVGAAGSLLPSMNPRPPSKKKKIQGALSPDKNKTWRGPPERNTFFLCLNFYGKSDPRPPPPP